MSWTDPVRWFDTSGFGRCSAVGCKKPAEGVLRGPGNESYGPFCERHAEQRLEKARRAREKELKS